MKNALSRSKLYPLILLILSNRSYLSATFLFSTSCHFPTFLAPETQVSDQHPQCILFGMLY